MNNRMDRRTVLAAGLALAGGAHRGQAADTSFAFPLLGDLHFDRLAHHDMEWLKRDKPNDVRQVQEYSGLTERVLPPLFTEIREVVGASRMPVPFVLHVGDLVEGLCGTPELARRHCREAVEFVRESRLGVPFLFTKGNHDVTGPGATEAFDAELLPFLAEGARRELMAASYTVEHGDSHFIFFDAYRRESLDWLEKTLEGRTCRHLFVVIHPPVVPFGARSNWALFTSERQSAERARLLKLLGRHRAMVLCGHLHKFGTVVRKTEEGAFLQLMISSIIRTPDAPPKSKLEGVGEYGPDLVRLEPAFQPTTEEARRALLRTEAPFVRQFEYAEAPGYTMVEVDGPHVRAKLYNGLGKRAWKTLDLTALLAAGQPA